MCSPRCIALKSAAIALFRSSAGCASPWSFQMKKLVLAFSLLTLACGTAASADMAVTSPAPPISAVASWAGFYLGIHGGYGWSDDDFSQTVLIGGPPVTGIKSKGWI